MIETKLLHMPIVSIKEKQSAVRIACMMDAGFQFEAILTTMNIHTVPPPVPLFTCFKKYIWPFDCSAQDLCMYI